MTEEPKNKHRYWTRIFLRSIRESCHATFGEFGEKVAHVVGTIIAYGVLIYLGFRDIAHEHIVWEIALFFSPSVPFLCVLIWKLFAVPATMDGELREKASKHEADLSKEISRLQTNPSPSDALKRENVKRKLDGLTEPQRKVIDEILQNGSSGWRIASVGRPDPWSELEHFGLIIKGERGRCYLNEEVKSDIKAINDEKILGEKKSE